MRAGFCVFQPHFELSSNCSILWWCFRTDIQLSFELKYYHFYLNIVRKLFFFLSSVFDYSVCWLACYRSLILESPMFHLRKIVVALLIQWQWINRWLRWVPFVFQFGDLWRKHSHRSFCCMRGEKMRKEQRKLMTCKKMNWQTRERRRIVLGQVRFHRAVSLVTRVWLTRELCLWLWKILQISAYKTQNNIKKRTTHNKNDKNSSKWKIVQMKEWN